VPQPALQSYAAYTPWLDRASADLLEGRDAPEFVLVDSAASTDGRNLVLDDPLWWRALMRWYDPVVLPSRLPLLLRRRAAPHDASTLDAGSARLRVGEWLPVPYARGPLFAELRLRPNLRGLLARALLRIPEVLLDLRFASGDSRTYRILPDTAVNGMAISAVGSDLTDLRDMLEGRSARHPVALRLRGTGTRFYQDAADIHFSEIRR
jgi:hypothetical protein